jgi:predicted esterase
MPETAPDPQAPLLRHVPATVHGRFLVRPPAPGTPASWFVGFHGYAQSADEMLAPFARCAPSRHWLVASVQALHPFYAGRSSDVVANWMTRQDRELAIADNVAYVDGVLDALEQEFGSPRAIVFAGFSQGVAMAYRAALLGRRACAAIAVAGGDVPPEFAAGAPRAWPRVLMATGTSDAYYTPAMLEAEAARLRGQGADVLALGFDGGHEWGDAVVAAVAALLAEVEGAPPPA